MNLEQAKKYAAEAKARNVPPCSCDACIREAMLPAVLQIAERWPKPAKKVRRVK